MAHYREQIRKAVATAVTGLVTTASRVKTAPVYTLSQNTQPTLVIWAKSSEPDYERGQLGSAPLWSVEIVIEGYAKANDNLLDTLDDIASEVETALYADAALSALCNGHIECGEQLIEFDTEGDEPLGKIEMMFLIYYHATEGAPDTKI